MSHQFFDTSADVKIVKHIKILGQLQCFVKLNGYIFRESNSIISKLQIAGGIEDNSKIIFLISRQKHTL